eukprot:TRINITY_DN3343_c0_g1_i1.p1 TRINITY_DN3343_c0_g1~~TRINITY_DN3343_c0_g1_i1.p1  ORF type:complete len:196 (-),score=55.61 TRINITY_DN3343_c0_g1_i1:80-646(-)
MGCNQSVSNDIKQDRTINNENKPVQKNQPIHTQPHKSNVMIVNSPKEEKIESETSFGKTPSDMRMEENESFQDLISKTQGDFIDVSMNSVQVPTGIEALEKVKDYQHHLKTSVIGNQPFTNFSMPLTNNNPNKVVSILNLASINEQNIEHMEVNVSNILDSIFKGFNIKDVGPIIDTLPEIEVSGESN